MKKTILLCAGALLALCTACSGNKNAEAADSDSVVGVVVEDTTAIVVTEDTNANGEVTPETGAVSAGEVLEAVEPEKK